MTNSTCKTCRYWRGVVGTTCGACCVRAPFYNPVFAEDDNYDGHWPFTEEKAWCGEHKPVERESLYDRIEAALPEDGSAFLSMSKGVITIETESSLFEAEVVKVGEREFRGIEDV